MPPDAIESFISRWETSGAAERANYQMFLSELCDILEVPRPDPILPDPAKNLYVFDRAITRVNPDGSSVTNYIDLYKARHFVNETKQGVSDCSFDPPIATEVPCSGGLRPSMPMEKSESASSSVIDGHRPPLQGDLAGIEASSPSQISNPQSPIEWPDRLPEQVAILRKLISGYDKSVVTPGTGTLSGLFGRKNKKRTEQIEGILETLKGLGQL